MRQLLLLLFLEHWKETIQHSNAMLIIEQDLYMLLTEWQYAVRNWF